MTQEMKYHPCAWCEKEFLLGQRKDIAYFEADEWVYRTEMLYNKTDRDISHTICPQHGEMLLEEAHQEYRN
jgi:hypothetical protein